MSSTKRPAHRQGRPYAVLPPAWRPLVEAFGGKEELRKHPLLGGGSMAASTLHHWIMADVRGTPQKFPARARAVIQALALEKGVLDPTTAIPVPAPCPLCNGVGLRGYTENERKALGLAPLRPNQAPELFECECQLP